MLTQEHLSPEPNDSERFELGTLNSNTRFAQYDQWKLFNLAYFFVKIVVIDYNYNVYFVKKLLNKCKIPWAFFVLWLLKRMVNLSYFYLYWFINVPKCEKSQSSDSYSVAPLGICA